MYPMSYGNPNPNNGENGNSSSYGVGSVGMGINPEVIGDAQASSASMSPGGSSVGLGDLTSFFQQITNLFNTGPATADTPISSTSPIGPIGGLFNAVTAFVQQNPIVALLGGVLLVVMVGGQMQSGSSSGRGRRG